MAALSILLTGWQWLSSKAGQWLLIGGAVAILLWRVASTLVTSGVQKEKLRSIETQLKEQAHEAKASADIDAMSAADVRKRMHDDWSRK